MSRKVLVISTSLRTKGNSAALAAAFAEGAKEAGAEVEVINLFDLKQYSGCVSCFGCKRKAHEGECVIKDGLKPVLDAVKEAGRFGIKANRAVRYESDSAGTQLNYSVVSDVVAGARRASSAREMNELFDDEELLADISSDFKKRHK